MATVKRPGLPEFWATGLAKILVGDQPCRFQAWINGHFRIEKRPQEDDGWLAQYKIDHTLQLTSAVRDFTDDGWKCRVEQWMKLSGQRASITGKPDIIRTKDGERPVITDIKSGSVRESDIVQVQVYQIIVPIVWGSPTMQFVGHVKYPTVDLHSTPTEANALKPKLFALVKELASDVAPEPSPSPSNCRFCSVSETDCPSRWTEPAPIAQTADF